MTAAGFPLVLVEWLDSAQPVPSWQWVADLADLAPTVCRSVGWLIVDGDDVKAVAPNRSGNDDSAQVSGVIRIPARCVLRVVPLSTSSESASDP